MMQDSKNLERKRVSLFWRDLLIFAVLPLIALDPVARAIKLLHPQKEEWYDQTCERISRAPTCALFIGDSRMGSAIDPDEFITYYEKAHKKPIACFNLGIGLSMVMEHWYGMRYLAEHRPNQLRGITVFYEALDGDPFDMRRQDMSVERIMQARIWLTPLLTPSDFIGPAASLTPASAKLPLAVSACLQPIEAIVLFLRLHNFLQWYYPRDVLASLFHVKLEGHELLKLANRANIERAAAYEQPTTTNISWKDSSFRQICNYVEKMGGRIVLVDLPHHSTFQKLLPPHPESYRRELKAFLESQHIPVIHTNFPSTNNDFEDLIHLNENKKTAFTKAFTAAYEEEENKTSPDKNSLPKMNE